MTPSNMGLPFQRPLCREVFSQESMKQSKLFRHLSNKHPDIRDKLVEFFERKLD